MIRTYKYKGQEYQSAYSVRQAIWKTENKIFGEEPKENRQEFWARFNVAYSEKEYIPTNEELAAQARRKRDLLLEECDYYVMPDYPSTADGLLVVKKYRQELRDITDQSGFPKEIAWPEKPSVLGGNNAE